ncbi:MAG: hypothetical protein HQL29_00115 [Candidatus Omnitrophica bacterium]|nr:hypothetical protein [Candidatus Omnitrophota bacterium]
MSVNKILSIILTISILFCNAVPVYGADNLSPRLLSSQEVTKEAYKLKSTCELIEKMVISSDKAIQHSKIADLRKWVQDTKKTGESGSVFDITFLEIEKELHVYVAGKYLIRYYDPSQDEYSRLFSSGDLPIGIISEEALSPHIIKKIYRIRKVDDGPKRFEDIFSHIRFKAGLVNDVSFKRSNFKVPEGAYKVAYINDYGHIVFHDEFIQDYGDIKITGIGFPYTFGDGETKWIDLADSIAYRVAMHELKLPRRKGHGHGYKNEKDDFEISKDEYMANMVGRKYSMIDDAMWLWYLNSYKMNDSLRFDDYRLLERLKWIFEDESQEAHEARMEFPNLIESEDKTEEENRKALEDQKKAIEIVLLINKIYFADRKEIGEDVRPEYEKKPISQTGEIVPEGLAVFAAYNNIPVQNSGSPQIRYANKPERELNERFREIRATRDIDIRLNRIIARTEDFGLKKKINAISEEESDYMLEEEVLSDIRKLYSDINVVVESGGDFPYYSKLLKETRKRIAIINKDIRSCTTNINKRNDVEANKENRIRLNIESVREYKMELKLRLLLAGMFLSHKKEFNIPEMSFSLNFNAAAACLKSASRSVAHLRRELSFRAARLRAVQLKRKIGMTGFEQDARIVFNLDGWDIEVNPEEKESGISVRQSRWVNCVSRLQEASRALGRKDYDESIKTLDSVLEIFNLRYIRLLKSYAEIGRYIRSVKDDVLALQKSTGPPEVAEEKIKEIREHLKSIASSIDNPKKNVWQDVVYADNAKAFRSQIHTIESQEKDISICIAYQTELSLYSEIFESGEIFADDRETAIDGIKTILKWASRGMVNEKQMISDTLFGVLSSLDTDLSNNELKSLAPRLRDASKLIEKRMDAIESINGRVKERAVVLFSELRDRDASSRLDRIRELVNSDKIDESIVEIADLSNMYFSHDMAEPGYRRINRILVKLLESRDLNKEEILGLIKKAIADIEHKNSFRIEVINEKNERKDFFIVPGTSCYGLLTMGKRDMFLTELTLNGYRIIGPRNLKNTRIYDNSIIRLSNFKLAEGPHATGGANLRNSGPGANVNVEVSSTQSSQVEEDKSLIDVRQAAKLAEYKDKIRKFILIIKDTPGSLDLIQKTPFVRNSEDYHREAHEILRAKFEECLEIDNLSGLYERMKGETGKLLMEVIGEVIDEMEADGIKLRKTEEEKQEEALAWYESKLRALILYAQKMNMPIEVVLNSHFIVAASKYRTAEHDDMRHDLAEHLGVNVLNSLTRDIRADTGKTYAQVKNSVIAEMQEDGTWQGEKKVVINLEQYNEYKNQIKRIVQFARDNNIDPELVLSISFMRNLPEYREPKHNEIREKLGRYLGDISLSYFAYQAKNRTGVSLSHIKDEVLIEMELEGDAAVKTDQEKKEEKFKWYKEKIKMMIDYAGSDKKKLEMIFSVQFLAGQGEFTSEKYEEKRESLRKYLKVDSLGAFYGRITIRTGRNFGEILIKSVEELESLGKSVDLSKVISRKKYEEWYKKQIRLIVENTKDERDTFSFVFKPVFLMVREGYESKEYDVLRDKIYMITDIFNLGTFYNSAKTKTGMDLEDLVEEVLEEMEYEGISIGYYNVTINEEALAWYKGKIRKMLEFAGDDKEKSEVILKAHFMRGEDEYTAEKYKKLRAEILQYTGLESLWAFNRSAREKTGLPMNQIVKQVLKEIEIEKLKANEVYSVEGDKYVGPDTKVIGPGAHAYEEKGIVIKALLKNYYNKNTKLFHEMLTNFNSPKLCRIPVEYLIEIGEDAAKDMFVRLNSIDTLYFEIYSLGGNTAIGEELYAKFGIQHRDFPHESSLVNTVTLFLSATEDAEADTSLLSERIGYSTDISKTLLLPIGYYNNGKDTSALARNIVLGLQLMSLAGKSGEEARIFAGDILRDLSHLFSYENLNTELNTENILDLVSGKTNNVIRSLRILLKYMPIVALDTNVLKELHTATSTILVAA